MGVQLLRGSNAGGDYFVLPARLAESMSREEIEQLRAQVGGRLVVGEYLPAGIGGQWREDGLDRLYYAGETWLRADAWPRVNQLLAAYDPSGPAAFKFCCGLGEALSERFGAWNLTGEFPDPPGEIAIFVADWLWGRDRRSRERALRQALPTIGEALAEGAGVGSAPEVPLATAESTAAGPPDPETIAGPSTFPIDRSRQ